MIAFASVVLLLLSTLFSAQFDFVEAGAIPYRGKISPSVNVKKHRQFYSGTMQQQKHHKVARPMQTIPKISPLKVEVDQQLSDFQENEGIVNQLKWDDAYWQDMLDNAFAQAAEGTQLDLDN